MEIKRTAFQGVGNIIRFNWHFYLIAILMLTALTYFNNYLFAKFHLIIGILLFLTFLSLFSSLVISYYIYDYSNLYQLKWLPDFSHKNILNINAGFDETSKIIKNNYPNCNLIICDFYDPKRHTEISIKRARKTYPIDENTIQVLTNSLPFSELSFDYSLAIFSAHEIRDEEERIIFFKELNRVTKPTGYIYVTEHLRDLNNFLAYTIGFFHFYRRKNWLQTFEKADLKVLHEVKITAFISTFILTKNGDTF